MTCKLLLLFSIFKSNTASTGNVIIYNVQMLGAV